MSHSHMADGMHGNPLLADHQTSEANPRQIRGTYNITHQCSFKRFPSCHQTRVFFRIGDQPAPLLYIRRAECEAEGQVEVKRLRHH